MRKQKKYHFIYKTTNPKGRYYIGAHSTDSLEDGYMGSGLLLKRSILSNGKENHKFEILEFCLDRQSLFEREAELVPVELMNDPLCMNLCKGGNGGWHHINSVSGMNRKNRTRESALAIGAKAWSTISDRYGSDHMMKIGIVGQQSQVEGLGLFGGKSNDSFLGKKHSEESKRKMSSSSKGTGTGNKNSQAGTCWVFKGIAKKIKREELSSYLLEGWIRGRK